MMLFVGFGLISAFGFLSLVGMDEGIESMSGGNLISLSNVAFGKELDNSFTLSENVKVEYKSLPSSSVYPKNVVRLEIAITGKHRRKLFDKQEFILMPMEEFNIKLRKQLVKDTGDQGLQIKWVDLGCLGP